MRFFAAAATLALCMAAGLALGVTKPPASSVPGYATTKQVMGIPKPPRGARGSDICRWAHDNECDEPTIGTAACAANSDYSDCQYIRRGEGDFCRYARDGECDEPNFGTGACPQGSDRSDCGNIAWMRNTNDSCATAFNGVCDEPGRGQGCRVHTDRSDCNTRNRPMAIHDHFFGRDDRVLVPVDQAPWRYIGRLLNSAGEACTATLIARNVIVTAAHCINIDSGVAASATFTTAYGRHSARTIAYLMDPNFDYRRFNATDEINGLDWALLRLDQPLGAQLGFAGVRNLTGQGLAAARAADLYQAGYAWDTGEHLSGHPRCHLATISADNTFTHQCDTTHGDSGSSFMVRNGDRYEVIGVDSAFRPNPDGPFLYVAVSAASFQRYVADFAAGRTGTAVGAADGRPRKRI